MGVRRSIVNEAFDLGRVLVGLAARGRLRERFQMALHIDDLRHPVDDRALDLLGDRMRFVEMQLAGQLEME